jgi:hypothetical protein
MKVVEAAALQLSSVLDFTLIDRTTTAHVDERAAPAANGEGLFFVRGEGDAGCGLKS